MKAVIRTFGLMLVALVCSVAMTKAALAATISGFVSNEAGNPIPGVQVCALNTSYAIVTCTTTTSNGGYTLSGLSPGTYYVKLDPLATGYQGQTVVANVPETGLCLNWSASKTKPAVALASPAAGKVCKVAGAWWEDPETDLIAGTALVVGGTGIGLCEALCGANSESE